MADLEPAFKAARKAVPEADLVLSVVSYLAPAHLPEQALIAPLAAEGIKRGRFRRAVAALEQFSLLSRGPGGLVTLHPLVAEVTRLTDKSGDHLRHIGVAAAVVEHLTEGSYPAAQVDPHLEAVVLNAAAAAITSPVAVRLARTLLDRSRELPRVRRIDILHACIKIVGPTLPAEDPSLQQLLVELASLHFAEAVDLNERARYKPARHHYQQALTIKEAVYGPDHPEVASTLGNLGNVHERLGEFQEALICQRRALTIKEAVYGPDHPEVARTCENMRRLGYV